jgi:hypothetical protein
MVSNDLHLMNDEIRSDQIYPQFSPKHTLKPEMSALLRSAIKLASTQKQIALPLHKRI